MKFLKNTILLAIILQFCGIAHANTGYNAGLIYESKPNKNSFFAELGGPAGLYSLNFERELQDNTYLRLGYSYIRASDRSYYKYPKTRINLVPVTVNYLFKTRSSHKFEIGGGVLLGQINTHSTFKRSKTRGGVIPTFLAGYRFQPKYGNANFRVGLNTLWVIPWPYMSFGYRF